jgi:S-adenosylmethionine:tRNA ribosyltransferase-isomerase
MVLDPSTGALTTTRVGALPELLEPGDVCVVNDAATLPASLPVRLVRAGRPALEAEARVFGGDLGPRGSSTFEVLLFGGPPSRRPTEARTDAGPVVVGDALMSRAGRSLGTISRVIDDAGRHVVVERAVDGVPLDALYAEGAAVGYAYLDQDPALWDVQTVFASRPWAAELPSAGRPISFELLTALRRRGVEVVRVTHGAGLSSSGRPAIDASLPRTERFEIDAQAAGAIAAARARGGRVVAVGTTVVRALESAAAAGEDLSPTQGDTSLVLGPSHVPRVVDAVLTGMHEPGTSHFRLLQAFAPESMLEAACALGDAEGFLLHELGDSLLVMGPPRTLDKQRQRASPSAA